jgi:hypothetical protein
MQENKEQTEKINKLLEYAEDAKEDITVLIDATIQEATSSETSSIITNKVIQDRINSPGDKNFIENLVVFKLLNTSNKTRNAYYVIRGNNSYIVKRFRVLTGVCYRNKDTKQSETNYVYLRTYTEVPNARHLYNALKRSNYDIVSDRINSNMCTTDLTETEFIDAVQNVFDNRLTIELELEELSKAKKNASKKVKEMPIKTKTKKY